LKLVSNRNFSTYSYCKNILF